MALIYGIIALTILTGCSKTFEAKLSDGGKPQEIKCTFKPDSSQTQFPRPSSVGIDFKLLMQDLTAYLYNPAFSIDCEY